MLKTEGTIEKKVLIVMKVTLQVMDTKRDKDNIARVLMQRDKAVINLATTAISLVNNKVIVHVLTTTMAKTAISPVPTISLANSKAIAHVIIIMTWRVAIGKISRIINQLMAIVHVIMGA